MSDFENHYNGPETPIIPEKSHSAGNLTITMLRYLKEASPWLKFLGILGFISCGFMALWALFYIIVAITATTLMSSLAPMMGLAALPFWLIVPIYIAAAVLFFFPSYFLFNFGTKIRKFIVSNSDEDLELALKNNKSYWKFCGIITIVYLSILPTIFIFSLIAGFLSSFGVF